MNKFNFKNTFLFLDRHHSPPATSESAEAFTVPNSQTAQGCNGKTQPSALWELHKQLPSPLLLRKCRWGLSVWFPSSSWCACTSGRGKKILNPTEPPEGLSVGAPGAVGGHWGQGGGGCWCCPAQDTRHGFGRWEILQRLFLCWLQVHTLSTSLQSHAGLIMSPSKHNLFTECAGLCHQHHPALRAHSTAHSLQTLPRPSLPRDRDTARGSTPSWPGGCRHGQVLPWPLQQQQQQHWAPCPWVGGRMSCQLRSIICSSL